MKLLQAVYPLVVVFLCNVAIGQPSGPSKPQPQVTSIDRPPVAGLQAPPAPTHFTPTSLTAPTVTPELWVYSQEQRRHDDPALAVRRKAEFQAEQRMARLASLKWYGFSNSRPEAGMTPIMGTYSGGWIGNAWNRYEWQGAGVWWR